LTQNDHPKRRRNDHVSPDSSVPELGVLSRSDSVGRIRDRERCVDAQVNPDFAPIVLRDVPEGEVSVLAELVEVLRPTAGN